MVIFSKDSLAKILYPVLKRSPVSAGLSGRIRCRIGYSKAGNEFQALEAKRKLELQLPVRESLTVRLEFRLSAKF